MLINVLRLSSKNPVACIRCNTNFTAIIGLKKESKLVFLINSTLHSQVLGRGLDILCSEKVLKQEPHLEEVKDKDRHKGGKKGQKEEEKRRRYKEK